MTIYISTVYLCICDLQRERERETCPGAAGLKSVRGIDFATPLYTQPPQQQQSTFILELQLEITNTKGYSRNTKSKFHKYKS